MAKIDILLATYNGAMYIKPQVLSIITQSFTDWRLLIHDDGSSDNTIEIIKSLIEYDNRIVLIEDGVKCGGAAKNFIYLTKFADADFVIFCDQDDIWFDNKVEFMYNGIAKKDHSKAQVLYTNSYVWKEQEGIKGLSTLVYANNLAQFLFLNSGVQGCVAIFNRKMNEVLKNWNGTLAMHDHILQLAGLILGEVTSCNVPLMLYRNHDLNVTGDTAISTMDISSMVRNKDLAVVDKTHFEAVEQFYTKYKDEITQNNKKLIEQYLKMATQDNLSRIISAISCRFSVFNSVLRLIAKIVFRPYINK